MTIHATFIYANPPGFVVGRTVAQAFSLVWWNQAITTYGQITTFTDIGFGGYHWHIGFKDGFWSGEGDRYTFDDILTDFYVTEPGGAPDPYLPTIEVRFQYHPVLMLPYIQYKNVAIPPGYQCEVVTPLPLKHSAWRGDPVHYTELPATFFY